MKINASERSVLLSIIDRFPRQHILVLGDLVADEFVYGEIARVSREAPVLILKERERLIVPGGGANAANNLIDLEAQVTPVGVVGEDEAGNALLRCFEDKGVETRHVLHLRGYETPTKSRILGGLSHWQRQQVVRLDREPAGPLASQVRKRLTKSVAALASKASALLVSDYGYGSTDEREVASLCGSRNRHAPLLPITVDCRFNPLRYKRVAAATPNEPEIEEAFGERIGNNLDLLRRLGKKALRDQSLRALLITRGRDGMVLFEPRRQPQHIPIFGSDQAVDVTGAGDTVIAAFTLAIAAGASFFNAAQLANCAAGLVVMKRGTATVTARELREAIRNA